MPTQIFTKGKVFFSTFKDPSELQLWPFDSFPSRETEGESVFVTIADCERLGIDPQKPYRSMLQAMGECK